MSVAPRGLGYNCGGCGLAPSYGENQCCTTPFGPSFPSLSIQSTYSSVTPFTPQQKIAVSQAWMAQKAPMYRTQMNGKYNAELLRSPYMLYPGVN